MSNETREIAFTPDQERIEQNPDVFITKSGERVNFQLATSSQGLSEAEVAQLAEKMSSFSIDFGVTKEKIIELLQYSSYNLYFLENDQGEVIAYATVFPDKREPQGCLINNLKTAPNYLKQGCATYLLKRVMADYDEVWLADIIKNPQLKAGMQQLYEKLGFHSKDGITYTYKKQWS
jgi:GNAT superfamily N-acetyltransferase